MCMSLNMPITVEESAATTTYTAVLETEAILCQGHCVAHTARSIVIVGDMFNK